MPSHAPFEADRELDVRELDGPPFEPIVAELEALAPDETLRLVAGFEPEPLYEVLEDRGFDHRTTAVADDEYHVAIAHAEDASGG